MKKRVSYLPEHKREELKLIVSIIKENVKAEWIILFGSYARNTWVEDRYQEGHITYEYKSDFDILVVVEKPSLVRHSALWHKINDMILRNRAIETSVSLIAHDVVEINNAVSGGQYFFNDVVKEGILLFDSKRFELAKPQKIRPEARKKTAQEDYNYWFKRASEFLEQFEYAFSRRKNNIAAFELHQATERFYMTTLLVYTHYKPKEHDIEKLGRQVGNLDPRFLPVFPTATPKEKHLFLLLKKAYIDARYKRTYKITKKELEYLAGRVKKLQRLTKEACKERISSYE